MRDLIVAAVLLGGPEIKDKDNQGRWEKRVEAGPDAEVPGFLVNLGPTGARAVLAERSFIVRHVFKGSPADGRLRAGDVLTGVFGRPFAPHAFGGQPHGYEGPIMDLGEAIERAESKDGRLVLDVLRGTAAVEVVLPLEPLGAFSPTFPLHCRKSERLRDRALAYLAARPDSGGGPAHARAAVALAFLANGDEATGRRLALSWNQVPGPGTWTWGVSYQLITLGEYHLLTQDPAVLPTIRALAELLRRDQYDGRIVVWEPKPGEDPGAIDRAQQLYLGGFGHAPYVSGVGKNGYGPMQYTTILAVIAWQIADACGVKADPKGLANALDFIHRGTNEAGYVAYGGEFTLNNGLVDPVAWRASSSGMNYVGRAGASLIAHAMSPEFGTSTSYLEKNRGYLRRAYKSLPDGHACSGLGFLWGLLGAGHDEAAARTMFDYHKAWFNMMRGHDGSFVIQPGRDYADGGYYLSSRYNPTAAMALALGLGFPRLRIQGTQVSVPGVNPKALAGPALAAYKALAARRYGEAARLLAPEDPMAAWIDGQARRALDALRPLEAAERWSDLKERMAALRPAYAGVARFDEAARDWEARMKGPRLAADQLLGEGHCAKALAALGSTPAPALEGRIRAAAGEIAARWTALRASGAWQALKSDLERNRERVRGLVETAALEAELASDVGRVLVEADRQAAAGAFGPALAALGALDVEPAKALRERARAGAEGTLRELEALEKEGRWRSLREGLSKARPKLAGYADERPRAWEAAIESPAGRGWIEAERLYARGEPGAAAKTAPPALLARIEAAARERIAALEELESKGDWHGLERGLAEARRTFAGAPAFDAKDAAWQAAFKSEPAKSGLRLGAAWARLRETGRRKDVEAFLRIAGDGYYAREARERLKSLR